MLGKCLAMHGQYLAILGNAWSILGMKSHTRDLGMNSHSFLFNFMNGKHSLNSSLKISQLILLQKRPELSTLTFKVIKKHKEFEDQEEVG